MLTILVVVGVLNFIGVLFLVFRRGGSGLDGALRQEFAQSRREYAESNKDLRTEVSQGIYQTRDVLDKRLEHMRVSHEDKLEHIRRTVEGRLESLQKDNSEKLEKMRSTVDEKLQSTLEKRLGESFKQVGDRLEQVHKGLGEMQSLATDVSDFKRVLTNVKTRGTWGEVQLENLLEQVFIKDHYAKQVTLMPGSKDLCDFAIKLPDKTSKLGFIYLPIDAKFPLEDYQRLCAAEEKGDTVLAAEVSKSLINRIKLEAKSIREKYVLPPATTDFAVLYVPIESMYAEILRTPGLFEMLQSTYRVTVAGPTTIAAILSSYQLGFRTLAIAENTSIVWEQLTTIQGEFGKFGGLLEKTRDRMVQATATLDDASRKSRTIESKLNKVQKLADKTADAVIAVEDTPLLSPKVKVTIED